MAPPSAGHSRRAGSGAVASLARGHHRTGLVSLLGPAGPDGGALISLSEQIWRAGGHDRRAPRQLLRRDLAEIQPRYSRDTAEGGHDRRAPRQLLRPHTPRCDACRPPLPTPYSVLSRASGMRVGHAIYKECVYKHEWFCEPAAELLEGDTPATRPRHVRDTSRTGRRAARVLGGLPRVEDGGVPRVAGRALRAARARAGGSSRP